MVHVRRLSVLQIRELARGSSTCSLHVASVAAISQPICVPHGNQPGTHEAVLRGPWKALMIYHACVMLVRLLCNDGLESRAQQVACVQHAAMSHSAQLGLLSASTIPLLDTVGPSGEPA